jgi:hypothetical protein
MKKIIIAIISLSMLSASCSVLKANRTEGSNPEKISERSAEQKTKPAVEIKKPTVGDTVVARWGGTSWAEGKLESIDKDEAKIVWTEDASKSDVELKDVFLKPAPDALINVKSGDYTVVKGVGNWWQEAEIREVNGSVIKAKFIYNNEVVNLSADKVLAISPTVAEDIKDTAAQQNFLTKAQEHFPLQPAGYKPKAGDRVLAPWTSTSWYPGKVKSVSDDKVLIAWEAGMAPDEVVIDKVVPFPTADAAQAAAVNDFVLLKPAGGSWTYGQVTSVSGTSIEAKTIDSTREYKAGEFVVLR